MDRIYLDNAATTATAPEVLDAMLPYFAQISGNPSSTHSAGREARRAVDMARRQIASAIGAKPQEIFFTAGGSESDNWALKGVAFANRQKGSHIITSAVEHHAVLHTCAWLEQQGFRVTYIPTDESGRVHPGDVEQAITDDTVLISIMTANNEVGTLQPVQEIGQIAHSHGVLFHTDAVQAAGAIPLNVDDLHADLLSMSGHKFHGPKGIGVLYVRQGVRIDPLIHGGAQERGMRAGTENLPGIVGIGKALELAVSGMSKTAERMTMLRDRLIEGLLQAVPGARLNGDPAHRLPNNVNISFDGINGEALLMQLDLAGICASTGSACTSGSNEPSHVLTAMGLSAGQIAGSLRLTLGTDTTPEEIERVLTVLPDIIGRMR